MCGIAGIAGGSIPAGAIGRMTAAIAHRGPDASGFFESPAVHLGHRRLSILDTSERGTQPMRDASGRYLLVHNGEIYNFQELRSQIDYAWRTGTDTELILAAYQKWGPRCLERFAGMFAFAIWDTVDERLFIARDRLGIKPLYFHHAHGQLCFASG
jgi:asparagine synthase (glutamine-hydrolysing)